MTTILARALPQAAPDHVRVKPSGYLGPAAFTSYKEATRGSVYDATTKSNLVPRHAWPAIRESVLDAGFVLDDCLTCQGWAAQAAEQDALASKAAQARIAQLDEALRREGKTLRPYQLAGIRWLVTQRAAILADEQGLGKTVQALCALAEHAPIIVECPASLRLLWRNEIRRWRSDLSPVVQPLLTSPEAGQVFIVGDSWVREYARLSEKAPMPEGLFLLSDEAHRYKGRSQRTKAMQQLCAEVRRRGGRTIALTGTPLMNRPPELWTLLHCFGAARKAFGSYGGYMKAWNAKRGKFNEVLWGEPSESLHTNLGRVSLRRTRAEVLPELPPKSYQRIPCELRPRLAFKLDAAYTDLEPMLIKSLQDPDAPISLGQHAALMAELAVAKTEAMHSWIEQNESDGPLVVFSTHVSPILELDSLDGWSTLTGDTPMAKRQEAVEMFQAGKLRGLGLTVQAGGTGLTLTRSHRMLFVDRSYVPADNWQAEDRLCRFGQENPVLISILVADHKLEHRLDEILQTKSTMIQRVV